MKKMLLLIFSLSSISYQLFAQAPTLTENNTSPLIGDAYVNQGAFSATVPVYDGGAAQNWDYTNLTDSGSAVAFQVVPPASTPYADSFPKSNLCIKSINDSVFSYFTTSSSGLVVNGAAISGGAAIKYDPFRVYTPYPFTFNDTYYGSVTAHLSGYNYTPSGTDSVKADGYGTLLIPGKTFANVLRVQSIDNLTYTYTNGPSEVTVNSRTVGYLYLVPDYHAPVVSDVTTEIVTTITIYGLPAGRQTNTSRSVNYLKAFVLPVSFQSFKATLQNKDVNLAWNTAQETNTNHFIVQQSLTGRDFRSIASVYAKGNTQGAAYTYNDKSFANSLVPAVVYYRIQSVDKDGKTLVSEVAIVKGNNAPVISIYPNPASHVIHIASNNASVADIAIYDAKGSLVKQWHSYAISQPVNISALTKGSYIIKVTIAGKTTTTTVIKQ